MKVQRVLQIQININHLIYNTISDFCFKSKNVYNYGNYLIRQTFIITSHLSNNILINQEQQEYLNNINSKVDDYNKFKLNNLKKKQAKGKCLNKKYKPLEYFNKNHKYIPYDFLDYLMKDSEPFRDLGSNSSQQTLRTLDKNWKSFFELIKEWKNNPNKLLGRPKLPKYKNIKNGKFPLYLCNNQFKVKGGYLYFSFKPLKQFNNIFKINIPKNSKLIQLRFIPRNNIYNMELVYEKDILDEANQKPRRIVGIDLGVNNFATLTNNIGIKPIIINGRIIKSINQFYNKKLAYYKSILKKTNKKDWSNKLDKLTIKRNNKIKYYMHCASKNIIEYCIGNNINTIIIGKNNEWKQNSKLYKTVNQHFVQLPYEIFIKMIQYKAEEVGIKVILINESYTSGTSFLDNESPIKENYNKSRRIVRGLFKSNKGILINSDVNGSLQIIKKAVSNAFKGYEIEGLDLNPLVICA
ncbi:RNA-guided endonuclease InsQ/TnpB family protein [Clostridium sp. MT-14]|uniref:RNA-guided endonuclease InsQ/TnpB family protein n=1 Tax=Clostridium sp. MT-14 TaxID=3348360 RepID=UPI0035F43580